MSEKIEETPVVEPVVKEAPDLSDISEKVSNLTKGIASYRAENKEIKGELATALETIKNLSKSGGDEIEITPEEEKKMEALLKKKGVVLHADLQKKDEEARAESLQTVEKKATDNFIKAHPEYDDDAKWQEIVTEFGLYKTPSTIEGFEKILEKVHRDLSGDTQRKKGKAEARAEDYNTKRLSLGGGSQSRNSNEDTDDVDKLRKKYPNLSDEQILQTLQDINNLYPKDEK